MRRWRGISLQKYDDDDVGVYSRMCEMNLNESCNQKEIRENKQTNKYLNICVVYTPKNIFFWIKVCKQCEKIYVDLACDD